MEIFFKGNLDHLLYKRRMSASDLAKQLNVTRSAVGIWIAGKGYPRVETMLELVHIFKIGLDELMFSNLKDPAYKQQELSAALAAEPLQEYAKLKKDYEDLSRRLEILESQQELDPRHGDDTKEGE